MAGACFSPWSLESRNILADLGGWGMASSPARLMHRFMALSTPQKPTPAPLPPRAEPRPEAEGMGWVRVAPCSLSHPKAVPAVCHICCHHTRLVQGLTQW